MKFVKKVLLVLVCVLSLVGCGYQEMEDDQITDYLRSVMEGHLKLYLQRRRHAVIGSIWIQIWKS